MSRMLRNRSLASLLALTLLLPSAQLRAQSTIVQGQIVDVTQEDLYVDVGTGQGLRPGDIGTIGQKGTQIARVQVMEATRFSARLRILSKAASTNFKEGDRVNFHVSRAPPSEEDKGATHTVPKGDQPQQTEEFVPLLAPLPPKKAALPVSENIFHGRLRNRQLWQTENRNQSNYTLSSLDSDGSIERINGTSLSFVWSGLATYRSGSAFRSSPDYQDVKADLYRATLAGKFSEERGTFRVGRFLPQEVPSVGYVDGLQSEWKLSDNWRLGNVAGTQPRPHDLAFSIRDPQDAAYVTLEAGKQNHFYYSGTLGFLETLFNGKPDRTAFIHDQRADIGSRFNLYSTTELDMDWTTTHPRGGTRLTRMNLYGNLTITSFLGIRGGTDHYGHLDTRAERALFGGISSSSSRGYWRYWVGSNQSIGPRLRFNEDISFLDAPNDDSPAHWQVSATRIGLPFISDAQTTLTTYNLNGTGTKGYGGLLSGFFPFLKSRLIVTPSCGFRYFKNDTDIDPMKWELTDYAVRMDARFNKNWGVFGGVSQTYSEVTHTLLVESGLNYRW